MEANNLPAADQKNVEQGAEIQLNKEIMRGKILIVLSLFFLFGAVGELRAQIYDKKEGGGTPDPNLSQKDNDYLTRQAKYF